VGNQQLEETNLIIQWYVPNRVLYVVVRGPLSERDSTFADETFAHYLSEAKEHMHVLLDVTRARKATAEFFHMPQRVLRHPHISWIVTVGVSQNPIINFGISALSLKSKIHHRDCPHAQAALDFLQHTDPTLPDLAAYSHRLI
jgi:hypothetical protein